ncbi:hypothetical protein KDD17_07350 [Sulfitobacter albidus]|uniref:Uncharacterized protein n=1 Tax=Sulfitobacter albidus TaxID=2829501 RepID=A0A975JFU7_9RHOB|nr:hypothetical protein [Sulfitobacter albidus]QUJ77752.1 hypothetical protein KDD17_07350 [Sulfitobacter albidus]
MIGQLAKETGIAAIGFFALSFVIDLAGETMADRITGTLFFAVVYAILGLGIKLWKRRGGNE